MFKITKYNKWIKKGNFQIKFFFYSSEFEGPETHNEGSFNYSGDLLEHPFSWEFEIPPSSSSCTSSDRGQNLQKFYQTLVHNSSKFFNLRF